MKTLVTLPRNNNKFVKEINGKNKNKYFWDKKMVSRIEQNNWYDLYKNERRKFGFLTENHKLASFTL